MLEDAIKLGCVENISPNERTPADTFGMAAGQVVEGDRQKAFCREHFTGVAADEPGAAGDEDGLHGALTGLSPEFLLSRRGYRA